MTWHDQHLQPHLGAAVELEGGSHDRYLDVIHRPRGPTTWNGRTQGCGGC